MYKIIFINKIKIIKINLIFKMLFKIKVNRDKAFKQYKND